MKGKSLFYSYLLLLHIIAIVTIVLLKDTLGWWFFVAESLIVISLLVGFKLIRQSAKPLEFVQAFSDMIEAEEYNARYSSTGHSDMDELIHIYNRMLSRLQKERLALGEQRGFLESFLQVTPVGIIILNFDHQIHSMNPSAEAFLQTNTNDTRGKPINTLDSDLSMHLESLPLWQPCLWNNSNAQRLRCHRGEFKDRGFPRSYYLIEDVTTELQHSEKEAYEKLIRMVSHEVNNTVASTNSLLHSCQHYGAALNEDDRSDFNDALHVLIARNSRLNDFTHRLASLARIPEPDKQLTSLRDLVLPVLTIFRPECIERNIKIVTDIEESLPEINLDQSLLEQALINIVKNALEAVPNNGNVSIKAVQTVGFISLYVIDDGEGLDVKAKKHLFKPFSTSKPTGQGLGLTLVREILNLHNFPFQLESRDGQTYFEIKLPLTL